MGADMCIGWFCINKDKNNEKDLEIIKANLIKAINKLGLKDYDNIQVSLDSMCIDDVDEELDEEVEEEDLRKAIINKIDTEAAKLAEIKKVKLLFIKIVEDVFDCLGNRDVSYLQHKGDIIFISGGMSWGDAPTDGYTRFCNISSLPQKILKAGGIR